MVHLPVLRPEVLRPKVSIAEQLLAMDVGDVRFTDHDRLLYSTDASLYQIKPIGVVIPSSVEQIQNLLGFCRQNKIALLPRGGGTSLAGQCTADAIVVDLSPRFRRVYNIDTAGGKCHAQAGVVPDQLNRELRKTGRFFAPDPATSAQATIGGCIGNNAAGARSIRYGRTSENLAGLEILLSSGEQTWLGRGAGQSDPVALRLATAIAKIAHDNANLIRQKIPKLVRRNAGYGIDLILDQLDAGTTPQDLDLSGLVCGSEGTLAITVAAELKLHPIPKCRELAILSFSSIDLALQALPTILSLEPSAVELLDSVVLEAASGNTECRRYLKLLPELDGKLPDAVLYVEFQSEHWDDNVIAQFDQLRRMLPTVPMVVYKTPQDLHAVWTLRKSGEALLHGLSSHRKPITFVEDNSVPVENLARFVSGFRAIVEHHGTEAAFYAHASVGVLHVRPMIDLHLPSGLEMMQSIALQVADLARDCGGVMSGEHGDGRARGPLLERFYGPELMEVFRRIKQVFDPLNLMNPGNIANPGPVQSITQNLRIQRENAGKLIETYFEYADQEGFRSAVERCNGAGFCRKTAGGTMCPSYRVTLDERHSTRGRGNALRLAITGQTASMDQQHWNDPDTLKTLDLCLSCKACKTECPSNVDVSRLKAEYTAQGFRPNGTPLSARIFGNIRRFNQVGSAIPDFANWLLRQPIVRWLANRFLKLSPARSLPTVGPSLYRWFKGRTRNASNLTTGNRPRVLLWGDCFTAYNEPEIGRSAIFVLERLGYEVILPQTGCCGRAMISVGLLEDAIKAADQCLAKIIPLLDQVEAVVVCEPSCLSAIKDDWLQLKLTTPLDSRQKVAERSMLVEDFVDRRWDRHPCQGLKLRPLASPIILHGHCHQKALWGDQSSSSMLTRINASGVEVLESGCCGMAGSFGYAADKFDLSMAIGELSVFPRIRSASRSAIITAPGTSCRHQIHDATGRNAQHPIQIMAMALGQLEI